MERYNKKDNAIYAIVITVLLITLLLFSYEVRGDSRSNRQDSSVFISTNVGAHIPTLIAIPVQIGYYSEPDLLYGVEWASRKFEYDDDNVFVSNGLVSNTGVFNRWFLSKRFGTLNAIMGFNQRKFNMDVKVRVSDGINNPFGGETKYTFSNLNIEMYTVCFGFGNQWTWSNGIFIGIDYMVGHFAISDKIVSKVSTGDTTRDKLTTEERKRAEEDLDKLGETIKDIGASNGYAMITIGWSF